MRREVAAGAGVHRHVERDRHRQRPHRVGLRLLLEGDGEHPLVHAGLRRATAATIAVEPPTEPAVCTRSSGLPAAPSASARYSSGIITPSNRSGALPTTMASMSSKPTFGVVERAVDRLAAQPGHRDVLALGAVVGLADADDGGRLLAPSARPSFQDADEVLLQAGPLVAWASTWSALAGPDPLGGLADADQAGGEHRVGGERAARRVDRDVVAEAELGAQDQLLVAERRVQLGDLDAVEVRRRPRPRCGRRGSGSGRGCPC